MSVIVPTYREAENVGPLIRRVKAVAERCQLNLEMVIVDDASDDGTREAVDALGEQSWVRVVARYGRRSLSGSVLEGLRLAGGDVLIVMDGDLSHPPESIPALLDALEDPAVDLAIGSRYVSGASIDDEWRISRALNSLAARALATGLTSVRDPTSGFFAVRRETFAQADRLNPIGYKIALELLIKCRCQNPREVPIRFSNRMYGKTKLRIAQRLQYVEHLRRLWIYRLRRRLRSSSIRQLTKPEVFR